MTPQKDAELILFACRVKATNIPLLIEYDFAGQVQLFFQTFTCTLNAGLCACGGQLFKLCEISLIHAIQIT